MSDLPSEGWLAVNRPCPNIMCVSGTVPNRQVHDGPEQSCDYCGGQGVVPVWPGAAPAVSLVECERRVVAERQRYLARLDALEAVVAAARDVVTAWAPSPLQGRSPTFDRLADALAALDARPEPHSK